jgi:hypothetical protein
VDDDVALALLQGYQPVTLIRVKFSHLPVILLIECFFSLFFIIVVRLAPTNGSKVRMRS